MRLATIFAKQSSKISPVGLKLFLFDLPEFWPEIHPLDPTSGIFPGVCLNGAQEDARLFHLAMGTRRQPAASFQGPRGEPEVEGNIDMQWIQAGSDGGGHHHVIPTWHISG